MSGETLGRCQRCDRSFACSQFELAYLARRALPSPTLCAPCREQQRIAFRNERKLYLRTCGLCAERMVSVHSEDNPIIAYCPACFWSDKWDPLATGREFDFSKPFFEQFAELLAVTPLLGLFGKNNENSDYVNQETDSKNCYLNVGGHWNQECLYCTYSIHGINNVDCYWVINCELCYECIECERCYGSSYLQDCENCTTCQFCRNCVGCTDCFGCFGLRHQQHHFFNRALSESAYRLAVSSYLSSTSGAARARKESDQHFLTFGQRSVKHIQTERCTGDRLAHSKNLTDSFLVTSCEDCAHLYIAANLKDAMDGSCVGWGELCYQCASSIEIYNATCVSHCTNLHDVCYCFQCFQSAEIFGCIGLRHQRNCILNKNYSNGEYAALMVKIKAHLCATGEWGKFFPAWLSPFGYNETVADEYYPLNRDEALRLGFRWSDYESPKPIAKRLIRGDELADTVLPPNEELLDCAVECEVSSRLFRFQRAELDFYWKMSLPLPRCHPEVRHRKRLSLRNSRVLCRRSCAQCGAQILSTIESSRPEVVYCESCYALAR